MRTELAYDSQDLEEMTGIADCRLAILSIEEDGLCEWKDSSRHAYSYDLMTEYSSIPEAEKGLVEYLLMVNAETIDEVLDFSGCRGEGDR